MNQCLIFSILLSDVNTFLSTHTAKQACQNIAVVKAELIKNLPGGQENIKSIYIKSTDKVAVPIFMNTSEGANDVKLPNNMTPTKVKKAKKLSGKRLKRKHIQDARQKKRELQAAKASSERQLLAESNKENIKQNSEKPVKKNVKKDTVEKVGKKAITKPEKPVKVKTEKAQKLKKSVFIK